MNKTTVQAFTGLIAELYDELFSYSEDEYDFYRHFLTQLPGPALELGCGTGQFLIPLLEEGFDVSGLDCSPHIIDVCAAKARQRAIAAIMIYCQDMVTFDLKDRFKTIFIPSCSFMLLSHKKSAEKALRCFYEHLEAGGQLLISLFIPNHQDIEEHCKSVEIEWHGQRVVFTQQFYYDFLNQIKKGHFSLRICEQSNQSFESHDFEWRWYKPHEFEMMLKAAGFTEVTIYDDHTLAKSDAASSTIVFRARKL